MQPGAEGEVRVGVAVAGRRCPRRRTPRGPGWRRRAARRSSGPPRRPLPRPPRPGSRCARRAGARSRSAASPRRSAPASSPGRSPRASSATRPLPKTLTEASCPALSRSTTAATSSSSESPAASRSVVRSSPGSCAAGRGARGPGRRTPPAHGRPRRPRRRRASGSYIRTIACDHATQCRHVGRREADQLGDDQDGQRLGVLPDDVERGWGRPRRAATPPARAPAVGVARRGRG